MKKSCKILSLTFIVSIRARTNKKIKICNFLLHMEFVVPVGETSFQNYVYKKIKKKKKEGRNKERKERKEREKEMTEINK